MRSLSARQVLGRARAARVRTRAHARRASAARRVNEDHRMDSFRWSLVEAQDGKGGTLSFASAACAAGLALAPDEPRTVPVLAAAPATARAPAPVAPRSEGAGPIAQAVVVESTEHYRQAAQLLDPSSDCVLEIGCARGLATVALIERLGGDGRRVVALDISTSCVDEARRCVGATGCKVLVLDALLEWRKLPGLVEAARAATGPGAQLCLFVDINGNRTLPCLVALMPALALLEPRLLVVKSGKLLAAGRTHDLNEAWQAVRTLAFEELVGRRRGGLGKSPEVASTSSRAAPEPQNRRDIPPALFISVVRAPRRFNKQGAQICRFFNYAECILRPGEAACAFSHDCNACLGTGHRAAACDAYERNESLVERFAREMRADMQRSFLAGEVAKVGTVGVAGEVTGSVEPAQPSERASMPGGVAALAESFSRECVVEDALDGGFTRIASDCS